MHKSTFWICTSTSLFPRTYDRCFKGFSFAITYLDDIIIFSRATEEHLSYIKHVFEKLRKTHLSMKLSKCHFLTKEIQYLRHILGIKGFKPLQLKPQAINNMHPPKTAKQVCTFLGLTKDYRKFIKSFAKMAKPSTLLLSRKKNLNGHQHTMQPSWH